MALHVQWSQIEAECDGYREGFVAIYRKYEGFPTDEKDGQGRTVNVTVRSFAEHVGIPERTFRRWVTKSATSADTITTPSDARARQRAVTSEARRLPAGDKAKLAAELLDDPDVAADPEVTQAANRVQMRSLEREEDDMRARGANPDFVEPFPGDLVAEASRIRGRVDGVRRDVDRLMQRAEPDQRPKLVGMIRPEVEKVLDHLDVGLATVPDFVPDGL
jgi:hypothetical protein